MTTRIVIVGAGGFGREVHSWINTSPKWSRERGTPEVVFVDDGLPTVAVRAPLISRVDDFIPELGDLLVCAIASPVTRRSVVEKLVDKGAQFETFIHDSVLIGDAVTIGRGAIVCPGTIMSNDIVVGDQVHINTNCMIGHDVSIGDYATMSSSCNLAGGVAIANEAFLATGVSIIPGRRVGAGAYVGVGSVVLRNVAEGVTVFGNPSKVIGKKKS